MNSHKVAILLGGSKHHLQLVRCDPFLQFDPALKPPGYPVALGQGRFCQNISRPNFDSNHKAMACCSAKAAWIRTFRFSVFNKSPKKGERMCQEFVKTIYTLCAAISRKYKDYFVFKFSPDVSGSCCTHLAQGPSILFCHISWCETFDDFFTGLQYLF